MARLGNYLFTKTDWQSSSKIMASITGMIPAETLVLRDGQQKRVPAAELVIGDVVFLNLGNKVPADVRILHCSGDLKFDRSILTGESEPISGTPENTDPNFMESRNIGMQGTHVVSGNGVGLVIQTGDRTVFGRIAKLSSSERSGRTTLQKVKGPISSTDCRKFSALYSQLDQFPRHSPCSLSSYGPHIFVVCIPDTLGQPKFSLRQ
jgi:magnesium-transporting ATPase (P-type)